MIKSLQQLTSPALLRTTLLVLCFAMLCTLGQRLYQLKDITTAANNTLATESVATLQLLTQPLHVEVFINPQDPQVEAVTAAFTQYREQKPDITIEFTDPALDPQRARELDVAVGGEIFLSYNNRQQRLTQVSEQSITTAMQRLLRQQDNRVLFTTGHGERSIDGPSNADLGIFAQQLAVSGFTVDSINLNLIDSINELNTTIVIAGPIQRFLANEVALLLDFISKGGNLLWLTDPDADDGLKALAIELGVERLPGVVIDLAAQQLQVERPDFAVVNQYSSHAATNGFSSVTLFPQAAALKVESDREWQTEALVQSGAQTWTETGAIGGKVAYGDDPREISGPFPLALALERQRNNKTQRVVVVGDGDFIADAWIANGGNRDLANRLFNWSVAATDMIGISAPTAKVEQISLSRNAMLALAGSALIVLPGLMFASATGVWFRRRYG